MRNTILYFFFVFILVSCAIKAKFPVSIITPAAEITAKMKPGDNSNYIIRIKAKNLAAAERLTPAMKTYVVWITTEDEGIKNVGQLALDNAELAKLETITPFLPEDIFITAETEADISYPHGIEIARTSFRKN